MASRDATEVSLRAEIRFLREALDRADALASVQAKTIQALENSNMVFATRMNELDAKLLALREG